MTEPQGVTRRLLKEKLIELTRRNKRFPKISEFALEMHVPVSQAQKWLQLLARGDNPLLIRKGNLYDWADRSFLFEAEPEPEPAPAAPLPPEDWDADGLPRLPVMEPELCEAILKEENAPPKPGRRFPPFRFPKIDRRFSFGDCSLLFIKIGMAAVGITSALVSAYFSYIWLTEFLPAWLAFILGVNTVLFAVLAFELVIIFSTKRVFAHWSRYLLAGLFAVLWIAVSIFSGTSTVAGQYNKHVEKKKTEAALNKELDADLIAWNGIKERKEELTLQLKESRERRAEFARMIADIRGLEEKAKYSRTWNDLQWRISQTDSDITRLSRALDAAREEERGMLRANRDIASAESGGRVLNFYDWLSGVLNADRDRVRFGFGLLPAIFTEILAPLGIAVALFLHKKEPRHG